MTYGCIGRTLAHSYSAELHTRLTNEDYRLCELEPEDVGAFLTRGDFRGINVTVPYKETVIPFLNFIDPAAQSVGAVNTVVRKDGNLCGYNTDVFGMEAALGRGGISLAGKTVMILGSGGTSKTAKAVAERAGAKAVFRISRTGKEGAYTYADLPTLAERTDVLINTTPVGMFPKADASPVSLSRFPHLSGVMDVVYNPLRTRLLQEAEAMGIPCVGGLYMLTAQAVLAAGIFRGITYPEDTCENLYRALLSEKRQLLLIGMPTAGKTEIGKRLAAALGKEHVDLDELYTQTYGQSPAEALRGEGEAAFRQKERDLLEKVTSHADGRVISTGGGCISREDNRFFLRQNGRTVFLDRPLSALCVAEDRPLCATPNDLKLLYQTRRPWYESAADIRIDGTGSINDVFARVLTLCQTEETV